MWGKTISKSYLKWKVMSNKIREKFLFQSEKVMEVLADYHLKNKKVVLFSKEGSTIQDIIDILQQVKNNVDTHFTSIINEGVSIKEDTSKKIKMTTVLNEGDNIFGKVENDKFQGEDKNEEENCSNGADEQEMEN